MFQSAMVPRSISAQTSATETHNNTIERAREQGVGARGQVYNCGVDAEGVWIVVRSAT
jgi:hypothetical protein